MALDTNNATNLNGWVVGYLVGAVVVLIVALLIVAIIATVRRIRATADDITASLVESQQRTEVLWALGTTKSTVNDITGMAGEARAALGVEMPDDTVTIWWITLAIGLVLALAVVLLLESLLSEVKSLTDSVDELWRTAGTVAINTDKIGLVAAAAGSVEALRDEALRHDALLASVLAAPPPAPATTTPGGWT